MWKGIATGRLISVIATYVVVEIRIVEAERATTSG